MAIEVPINHFVVSTVCFFNPDDAYAVVDQLNKFDIGLTYPVEVEVHTTKDTSVESINRRESRYPSAKTTSVHLEVPYDQAEVDHQVSGQRKNNFHLSRLSPVMHRLIYSQTGTADSRHGLQLSEAVEGRTMDINLHINTLVGFLRDGHLGDLQQRRNSVTVEQSVNHDFLYADAVPPFSQEMLYNPERTIKLMNRLGLNRFRLGLDHLTTHFDRQGIGPLGVIRDQSVQEQTVAMNIAGGGNNRIDYDNPYWASIFREIGNTKFKHPIKGIFTFNPIEVFKGRVSKGSYANFFADNIAKVLWLQSY